MNFSNTKGLKKLTSLILAGAMMLGLFTGCMKKNNEETVPSDTKPNINLVDDTKPTETQTTPPETTEPEITENTARVNSQLSIRNSPSKDAAVVGTLDAGDMVEVLRTSTVAYVSWGYITEPEMGWICMDYVTMLKPSTEDPVTSPDDQQDQDNKGEETTQQSYKGVITVNDLNIRNAPGTTGTLVGQYAKGDVVTILETKDGWGRTSLGWISLDYVNSSSNNEGGSGNNNTTGSTNNNTGNTNTNNQGNGSNTVIAKGIVTASDLNVRTEPSTAGDRVKSLSYGTRVEIYEKSDGWGRTKDGWISLNYVYLDGTKGDKATGGVITGSGLNIRSGPGTKYDSVGSYDKGTHVEVLAQFTYDGTTWGCTNKGWISMNYVYIDGSDIGESGNGVVNTDGLNIRKGPGTNYDAVGSYNEGDEITILFQLEVGETTWGCTSKGWISLKYVDLN